jgi:hypothetical protein
MIIVISYTDQSSTVLSASTWSEATAYGEGTGKSIQQMFQPNNTELVLNYPSSTNCYQLICKNTNTGLSQSYFVFEEDFQSLNTWIESLTDSEVTHLSNQQRNYVSL